jgi:hypothetical protein
MLLLAQLNGLKAEVPDVSRGPNGLFCNKIDS